MPMNFSTQLASVSRCEKLSELESVRGSHDAGSRFIVAKPRVAVMGEGRNEIGQEMGVRKVMSTDHRGLQSSDTLAKIEKE